MARTAGIEDFPRAVITHPVSNNRLDRSTMDTLADDGVDESGNVLLLVPARNDDRHHDRRALRPGVSFRGLSPARRRVRAALFIGYRFVHTAHQRRSQQLNARLPR